MYVLVSKTRPVTFISTGLIIRTQEYLLAFVPSVFKKNGMQNIIILASDSRKDRSGPKALKMVKTNAMT